VKNAKSKSDEIVTQATPAKQRFLEGLSLAMEDMTDSTSELTSDIWGKKEYELSEDDRLKVGLELLPGIGDQTTQIIDNLIDAQTPFIDQFNSVPVKQRIKNPRVITVDENGTQTISVAGPAISSSFVVSDRGEVLKINKDLGTIAASQDKFDYSEFFNEQEIEAGKSEDLSKLFDRKIAKASKFLNTSFEQLRKSLAENAIVGTIDGLNKLYGMERRDLIELLRKNWAGCHEAPLAIIIAAAGSLKEKISQNNEFGEEIKAISEIWNEQDVSRDSLNMLDKKLQDHRKNEPDCFPEAVKKDAPVFIPELRVSVSLLGSP
jgi:hypothetical protein